MNHCPMPSDESERLAALHDLGMTNAARDPELDCMVALACRAFSMPAAAITLVDEKQVWVKAAIGFELAPLDRDISICSHTVAAGQILVVENALLDIRFVRYPAVTAGLRFYAGVPLALENGHSVGTLCLLDFSPRQLTAEQGRLLTDMAAVITVMMQQHRHARTIARMAEDLAARTVLIREQAASLAHSQKIFERASAEAKIGVWECDLASDRLQWTDGVYDLFELPRGSAISREDTLRFYSADCRNRLEILREKAIRECSGFKLDAHITTAKGNQRWMRLSMTVEAEDGVATRIFGMKQDITEEKALWDQTRYLAETDLLTGLSNRGRFQSALATLANTPARSNASSALLLVDLDGFKQINDTFGHSLGDECLKEISARLKQVCDTAALVARIGGDEFAVLVTDGPDGAWIETYTRQILEAIRRPILWNEQSLQIGASIGIAIPDAVHGLTPSELFMNADLALYAAKSAGRNTFRLFTPDLSSKAEHRFAIVRTIAAALPHEELDLYYQPKIHLADRRLSGFEALLRWRRPDGDIVAASAFQEAFEDPGLSTRLGAWVVDKALRQARDWADAGARFGHIAINVSSLQLQDARFTDGLIQGIDDYGLQPGMIEVEVTGGISSGRADKEVWRMLGHLRRSGIRVALNGFGSSYSSLVHLRTHSIDVLKLDRSLVRDCLGSAHDRAILETTLGLGLRLGVDIVAEGIETIDQLECLKAMGYRLGQGFLFSQAVPASEAVAWHERTPMGAASAPGKVKEARGSKNQALRG